MIDMVTNAMIDANNMSNAVLETKKMNATAIDIFIIDCIEVTIAVNEYSLIPLNNTEHEERNIEKGNAKEIKYNMFTNSGLLNICDIVTA